MCHRFSLFRDVAVDLKHEKDTIYCSNQYESIAQSLAGQDRQSNIDHLKGEGRNHLRRRAPSTKRLGCSLEASMPRSELIKGLSTDRDAQETMKKRTATGHAVVK